MSNLGQDCAPTRQSQVGEQQTIIGNLMTELSEEIGKLEQRLKVCLRQNPPSEKAENVKKDKPQVELANRLSIHAEDLQKQVYRIRDIVDRVEL